MIPAIHLDGSHSSDVDGNSLTYQWSFVSQPAASTAMLTTPTSVTPQFTIDKPGTYLVQLIVNDGTASSDPDTVTITTPPPSADTGKITVGPITNGQVTVTGSAGSVEGNAHVTITNLRTNETITVTANADGSFTAQIGAQTNDSLSIIVIDSAGNASTPSTVTVGPPVPLTASVTASAPIGATPFAVTFTTTASVSTGLTYAWDFGDGTTANSGATQTHTYATPGTYTAQVTVSNGATTAQAGTPIKVEAAVGTLPPDPATVAPPINRTVATVPWKATEFLYTGTNPIQTGVAPGTIAPRQAALLRGKVQTVSNAPLSGVTITVLDHPEFGQTLTRSDGAFDVVVNGGGELIVTYTKAGYIPVQRQISPEWGEYAHLPDVVLIARDPHVTTVDLAADVPMQVARGSVVTDGDGSRQVTMLFPQGTQASMQLANGTTQPLSTLHVRATEFTVGANGPNAMPGELPATSGYTYAVELGVDEALVNGKKVAGQDVLFDQPVSVYVENFLHFPVGGVVPVGYYDNDHGVWVPWDNGRILKVLGVTAGVADLDTDGDDVADDTATLAALGVTDAERTQLATLYTPGQSLWRMSVTHFSSWDSNWPYSPPPDGTPPNPWEVPDAVPEPPPLPGPEQPLPDDQDAVGGGEPFAADFAATQVGETCPIAGSIVWRETQALGEAIPIAGTPFRLHYRSDRHPGYSSGHTLRLAVSGTTVPASLKRVNLEVQVAGRTFTQSFAAAPNLRTEFVWDGTDAYGRTMQGKQQIDASVGFVYDAVYLDPGNSGRAFAQYPAATEVIGDRARQEVTFVKRWRGSVGGWDVQASGVAGWDVTVHQVYDPVDRTVYFGTGEQFGALAANLGVNTVAGNGTTGFSGDGGKATAAKLANPQTLAVAADGSFYIADTGNNRVRRVGLDGMITTVAGNGGPRGSGEIREQRQEHRGQTERQARLSSAPGDGGPAAQAEVNFPTGIAIGRDGSLYIAETGAHRVRKVSPGGTISTVAGTGSSGFSGDEGPATDAELQTPTGLAVGHDGFLYIADTGNGRIRHIGPDGSIYTIAGNGAQSSPGDGDGGPARQAALAAPVSVAVGADGSVFVAESAGGRIRRISPSGIITTFAGGSTGSERGDGGLATNALLNAPAQIALAPDGSLYVADQLDGVVRKVGVDGRITTVAGATGGGSAGENEPATAVQFARPTGVAVDRDGTVLVLDRFARQVRRVAPPLPGFTAEDIAIASPDGTTLTLFNAEGRQLETRDVRTGALRYQFTYDSAGRLTQITDVNNNTTTIQRDGNGTPTAIVSPFGQHTSLSVNAEGYLEAATNPAGETISLSYSSGGLLSQLTDALGGLYQFTYDGQGRVTQDHDPASGAVSLARSEFRGGHNIGVGSALHPLTQHQVQLQATGTRRIEVAGVDGSRTIIAVGTDGGRQVTTTGTLSTLRHDGPDPRFGLQAPIPKDLTATLPSGLTLSVSTARSVTLTDPQNPLSLEQQTDLRAINGRVYASTYQAATKTITTTTPAGRTLTTTIDDKGQTLGQAVPGIDPLAITYDSRGRVSTTTQGDRTLSLAYDTNGYLASVTDPLARSVSFTRDAVGRVLTQTLPGGRTTAYTYDANGNLTAVVPPGRTAHVFTYTAVNQRQTYVPPMIGATADTTVYHYNLDRQLSHLTRPDGQEVGFVYDERGQLQTQTLPQNQALHYTYETGTRGDGHAAHGTGGTRHCTTPMRPAPAR